MRTLFLDDDKNRHVRFYNATKVSGEEIFQVWNAEDCIKALQDGEYDLASLDHDLRGIPFDDPLEENSGSGVVRWVILNHPKVKRFIVHSYNSVEAPKMVHHLTLCGYSAEWIPFNC